MLFRSVGLIGGSLALALKKHCPHIRVTAVDAPEVLSRAQRLGIVDSAGFAESDLTVLAAPVNQILELLKEHRWNTSLLLDVGSTKVKICDVAESLQLPFLGGHPMTGNEKSGPEAASADLFAGAPFFLSEVRTTPKGALNAVSALLRTIGAEPIPVSAKAHDRIVAKISHLPQLLSTLLAIQNAGNMSFAGPGARSMTRLAASPFHVWRDIDRKSTRLNSSH